MENIKKIMEEATDSLTQGNQEKQTGLDDMDKCHKHGMVLRSRKFWKEGGPVEIFICLDCENEEYEKRKQKDIIRRCHEGIGLSERLKTMTFESYIPSSGAESKAKKTCEEYANGIVNNGDSGGLILLGGVGTGKTHLAIAICKKVCDSGKTSHLTSVPKMIRHIRSTWANGATDNWGRKLTEDGVINIYADYNLLVIDEIGVQYGTPAEKVSIAEVINERYNRLRPTILIGNVKQSEVEEFVGSRVIDRVKDGGMVLVFDWESHRKLKR